jgi:hypothetical protein
MQSSHLLLFYSVIITISIIIQQTQQQQQQYIYGGRFTLQQLSKRNETNQIYSVHHNVSLINIDTFDIQYQYETIAVDNITKTFYLIRDGYKVIRPVVSYHDFVSHIPDVDSNINFIFTNYFMQPLGRYGFNIDSHFGEIRSLWDGYSRQATRWNIINHPYSNSIMIRKSKDNRCITLVPRKSFSVPIGIMVTCDTDRKDQLFKWTGNSLLANYNNVTYKLFTYEYGDSSYLTCTHDYKEDHEWSVTVTDKPQEILIDSWYAKHRIDIDEKLITTLEEAKNFLVANSGVQRKQSILVIGFVILLWLYNA